MTVINSRVPLNCSQNEYQFIVFLTEISHHRHSPMISCPITLFWQRVNQFLRCTTLICRAFDDRFNYQFEIFGLIWPGIELRTCQTQTIALPQGYHAGYTGIQVYKHGIWSQWLLAFDLHLLFKVNPLNVLKFEFSTFNLWTNFWGEGVGAL